VKFPRSSGVLLHPTSLAGPYGIGDLGPEAYAFVDFLAASNQHIWQVLPLGPTGFGDSPYQGLSAFAGNTYLVSPDLLVEERFLDADDLNPLPRFSKEKVSFGKVIEYKERLLTETFKKFRRNPDTHLQTDFLGFCQKNSFWLDDYALFRVLKESHGGQAWIEWRPELRQRKADALAKATEEFSEEIEAQKLYQFLFYKQWHRLKDYCNKRGVTLIGDMPIFVAYDSVDVWRNPENFKLNADNVPTVVSGVPPDYFSATGQLWGNPLYDWDQMRKSKFDWWIKRMEAALETFDIIRIDHFRGFAACWEIPYGEPTARNGKWVPVPGKEFFTALTRHFTDNLPIIVEDLGVITPDVEELRDSFNFPGMRILQMGFGGDSCSIDLPHNYIPHSVVYTGTHDNNTTVGWFKSKAGAGSTRDEEQVTYERKRCLEYLRSNGKQINWDFITAAWASVSCIALVPMQDVLGLGTPARMNLPASQEGNWSWRMKDGAITPELTEKLKQATQLYGRDNALFQVATLTAVAD
jgi:4-alpha-glucanotransferase